MSMDDCGMFDPNEDEEEPDLAEGLTQTQKDSNHILFSNQSNYTNSRLYIKPGCNFKITHI